MIITWAMIMAASVLAITWFALLPVLLPANGETSFENLLSPWVAKPGGWSVNPLTAFHGFTQEGGPSKAAAVLATAVGCITVFVLGLAGTGIPLRKSLPAVSAVTVLAVLAWLASTQTTIKSLTTLFMSTLLCATAEAGVCLAATADAYLDAVVRYPPEHIERDALADVKEDGACASVKENDDLVVILVGPWSSVKHYYSCSSHLHYSHHHYYHNSHYHYYKHN